MTNACFVHYIVCPCGEPILPIDTGKARQCEGCARLHTISNRHRHLVTLPPPGQGWIWSYTRQVWWNIEELLRQLADEPPLTDDWFREAGDP